MVPARHILSQGPVLKALGETALRGIRQRFDRSKHEPPVAPGPEIHATIAARPADLVADYVRHVGGDPDVYRDSVPAHMFPQWGFPYAARTLETLPYPLLKVFNAGCRLDLKAPLPQGQPLHVSARLETLKVDERRVLLSQRIITGVDLQPEAIVAHLYAYVPLGKGDKSKPTSARPTVPEGAREIAHWKLPVTAGLEFAILTGDFNPVHWVRPYARALGFRDRILHGFSTMARTIEALNGALFHGRSGALASIDVRFTKPLVLPADVRVFVKDHHAYVGESVGSASYLEASFAPREGVENGAVP
jgi:hypothetical protein